MEPTLSSETSAFILQTPGKFPKEHRLHSKNGEILSSLAHLLFYILPSFLFTFYSWSPRTKEPTLSSETSAFILQTPGKFPKEHRLHFQICFTLHTSSLLKILAQELFFKILAHPVYKMWIIQEPNKLELWNKLHFKEKKTESIGHV